MTTLLDAPPKQASNNSGFLSDSKVFGSGAEALGDGTFVMDEGNVDSLINQANTERGDSVYGPGDLTHYVSQPTIQRDAPLIAEQMFPIDAESKSGGFGMKHVDLLDISKFGQAGFVQSSNDFPLINFKGRNYQSGFATLGIAYKMTFDELEQQKYQSRRNFNYQSKKQQGCITALRQGAQRVAFLGNSRRQILGVLNNPFIQRMASPVEFDQAATPEQMRSVLVAANNEAYLGSKGTARMPNALGGSARKLTYLASTPISTTRDVGSRSILQYSLQSTDIRNVYKTFWMEDDVSPTVTTASLLFYRRDRQCISWHYPVSYRFLTLFNYMGYELVQLCVARVGSVWPLYPEDTLLLTGV